MRLTRRVVINTVAFLVLGAGLTVLLAVQVLPTVFGSTYSIYGIFTAAGGVAPNQEVTYRGVQVGRVGEMSLTRDAVKIEMKIESKYRVPKEGTRALYGPNSPIGGFLEGIGIHVVFAQIGILLALLFVTLPLVVRTVQPVLLELDENEEEAARVLGATRWYTFRRVVLPKLRAGIAAGGLLAFARAIGEFGAVVIVSGNIIGKTLTAPVLIFQLSSQFQPNQAAAITLLIRSGGISAWK